MLKGSSSIFSREPVLPAYTEQFSAFLEGRGSPRKYLERCLDRIAAMNDHIKAFVHLDLDRSRRLADDASERFRLGRPLSVIDGMPIGAKDIIETRNQPTQMNSPIFAGHQGRRDAACIVALQRAGAIIVGKTTTTEFACGRSAPTVNPHDFERTPGGSSSGSAAAIAARMIPAALGTQTQGSIIRPASFCGVVGIKPTHGLLRVDGVAPLARTLDHLGILACCLADAWALLAIIAKIGPEHDAVFQELPPALPPARQPSCLVRLEAEGWKESDDEAKTAFDDAIRELSEAGVKIFDRSDSRVAALENEVADASETAWKIFAWEAQWPLKAYLACGAEFVSGRVQELIAFADQMDAGDYRRACERREALRQTVAAFSSGADGFVTLSASGAAPQGLAYTGSRLQAVPWTLVGGPSFSLPLLQCVSLPLGLQVMGFRNADVQTASIARWIGNHLAWRSKE